MTAKYENKIARVLLDFWPGKRKDTGEINKSFRCMFEKYSTLSDVLVFFFFFLPFGILYSIKLQFVEYS